MMLLLTGILIHELIASVLSEAAIEGIQASVDYYVVAGA